MDNQDPSTPISAGDVPPEAAVEASPAPHEQMAQAYTRLAAMTPSDYDKVRKSEAAPLGVRLVTLASEVAKRRAEIDKTLLEHNSALLSLWKKLQPLLAPPVEPARRAIGFHARRRAG